MRLKPQWQFTPRPIPSTEWLEGYDEDIEDDLETPIDDILDGVVCDCLTDALLDRDSDPWTWNNIT